MNMVGHETVSVKAASGAAQQPAEVKKIEVSVLLFVETLLTIIPALTDMNRYLWEDDARATRHISVNGTRCNAVDEKRGLSLILGPA